MQNVLTIDVEDYFHVTALRSVCPVQRWDSLPGRVERNTREILDLLSSTGTRATFFVLGWVAERLPRLVAAIADQGHEVASHGYSHTLVYRQGPEAFREETIRSRRIIEDAAGVAVKGYRAASCSITSKSLWAFDVLAEAGFEYDSSVFPVTHDLYGIPGWPTRPTTVLTPRGNRIVELPLSTVRILGRNLPVAGGGYFRIFPYRVTRWAIRRMNRLGSAGVVYLHPWEIDAGQPRFKASPLSRFRHYTGLSTTAGKLRALLKEFQFAPAECLAAASADNETTRLAPQREA